jgi:DNA-nicking Smr family endonuclease
MSKRKERNLRPDEEELWRRVVENTKPLNNRPIIKAKTKKTAQPGPDQHRPPSSTARMDLEPFQIGAKASTSLRHDLAPEISESFSKTSLNIDRKAQRDLKRGKSNPEARLDLHGITLAQAHPALNRFILGAQADGKRLVLVITGKGKDRDEGGPIPQKLGILRHQVPHWLQIPPLKQAVAGISVANQRHGGAGAYYVRLRRR